MSRLFSACAAVALLATISFLRAADNDDSAVPLAGPSLASLEARAARENSPGHLNPDFHRDVVRLVESDTLSSGEDFFRAAQLACPPVTDFRCARMRYELTLAAVARDNRMAEQLLPVYWDEFLGSIGRPFRIDALGLVAGQPDNDVFSLDPAPAAIQNILRRPAEARTAAGNAADNSEVQQLVDADQKARSNWAQLTAAERRQLVASDRERNRRIRAIVTAGGLHTARDFAHAALVMQHSRSFAGFQIGHELAVCSLLLGDRGLGRQLVALTYDRMLNSVGHEQRFGTQANLVSAAHADAKPELADVDERGICDAERLALGLTTLAAKRADFYAHPSHE